MEAAVLSRRWGSMETGYRTAPSSVWAAAVLPLESPASSHSLLQHPSCSKTVGRGLRTHGPMVQHPGERLVEGVVEELWTISSFLPFLHHPSTWEWYFLGPVSLASSMGVRGNYLP
jgi:hypothetical protein